MVKLAGTTVKITWPSTRRVAKPPRLAPIFSIPLVFYLPYIRVIYLVFARRSVAIPRECNALDDYSRSATRTSPFPKEISSRVARSLDGPPAQDYFPVSILLARQKSIERSIGFFLFSQSPRDARRRSPSMSRRIKFIPAPGAISL